MSSLREPRFWTALLVCVVSALTIWGAMPLLRLGVASIASDEATSVARFLTLVDNPSVGALARLQLLDNVRLDDSSRRVANISALLAGAPLSSGLWLDLARARYADGAPTQKIFGALAMSQTTGPNEALVMAGRAIFGLPLWRLGSPDMHKMIVRDLIGGWIEVTEARRVLFRVLLMQARSETRAELREILVAQGEDGSAIASRLGLTE